MHRPRPLTALLLAFALVAAGCAGAGQTASPPPDDADMESGDSEMSSEEAVRQITKVSYDVENLDFPELSDFQVPQVEEMTLDNGMKIFLIEDHELPTVNASARVGVGSVWAPEDHAGLASITGTVMRTGGTQSMTSDEVNQLLENLGASVETYVGETSGGASMSTLAENVDDVLPVFVDVLANPAFAEDKVAQAKSQTRGAISRRNDNPEQIVSREFDKLVYGADSPYARIPQYYTLSEINREDLVNFHDEYFHPNNTMLSVWGDFDTPQMKEKLRNAFSGWEQAEGFTPPEPPQPEGERDYSVNLVEKTDVNQSTVRMGYLGTLTRDDPDYFPVIVMNEVLSGGFTSRLFKNVRTDQGLAYSVSGSYNAGYRTPGPFLAQVQTKSGTTVEAAQSVMSEIEGMRQAPPSEEEVTLAKDSFLNSFVFNFDTRSEILDRLMTYEKYDYPRDFLEQTRQGVAEVTPQDVYRVSQKYLAPEAMDVLVLGNPEGFGEPISTLSQGGGEVNEIDISIPTSPPGEAEEPIAGEEDRAAGQDLLAEVREAMGGSAYDQIENVRQSLETQAGQQTIAQTVATDLTGQIHAEVETPQGMVTIIDTGEQTYMRMGGNTRPAPPQLRRQFLSGLQQDPTYLMARADDLEPADQGTQTVEGTAYRALRITPPKGDPFTMLVHPDTMMPARLVTQAQGQEVTTVLGDFREESGVMVPYERAVYQGGQQRATTTVTGFETNVGFPDGYFTVDQ